MRSGRMSGRGWGLAAGTTVLCSLILTLGGRAAAGEPPTARVAGTIEIEGNPDGMDPYVIVEAFPNLELKRPVWIGHPPDGTNYLWVLEQDGLVKVFENRREVKKASIALDFRKRALRSHNEEGLQAMAFHPDFKKNKTLFLSYSAGSPRRLVISRFKTSGTRRRILPRSEEVLIRQRQPYGNHNGGCLAFGPDEHLYVSIGDGGSHGDPFNYAQNLQNWFGTILRLDVSAKKGFAVPDDNPFSGVQHTRAEIWAYGLQNVRRFAFDRVTGALWAGDIGNDQWQEINLIEKGGNYGWSLREGTGRFKKGRALVALKDPVVTLGGEEARRIIGGTVYRGRRMPGLVGAYLFGDLATGNVWALRWDGKQVKERILLGRGHGVTCFGTDKDGEIYVTCVDGEIHAIAPWTGHKPGGRFPRRLSDTGLFTNMTTLTPHKALVPYSINVPLWSDGAGKQRLFMLPGTEKIHVRKDGSFEFPVGTIFVKHFFLGEDARGPLPGTRLETRLFLRSAKSWAGYTYVWDAKQEDAHLLEGRLEQERSVAHEAGSKLKWTFPSRSDCMSCHTEVGGRVLGFRAEQIDRVHDYGGAKENQIDVYNRLGLFDGKVTKGAKRWPDWDSGEGDERAAVRAYLDVNCAMCHQPEGPGNALIDLRYDTPLKQANLVDRRPGQWNLGVYEGRLLVPGEPKRSLLYVRLGRTDRLGMPPLAHNVADRKAMERVRLWIKTLKK